MALTLSLLLIVFLPAASWGESPWGRYKSLFMTKDGRIIDYYQNNRSHSEGQGYGMLLAVAFNDKESFKTMYKWTNNNLGVRDDNLFAWLWGKRHNGKWGVIATNNATDGDMLIALAMIKAGNKWGDKEYIKKAQAIVKDIRLHVSVKWNGHIFILPSYYGFADDHEVVLNISYFIMPAFKQFAKIDDKKFWSKVFNDANFILKKSNYGKLNLPPDWSLLKGKDIKVNFSKSAKFSYGGVRILLQYAAADAALPGGATKILDFYKKQGYVPDWVDLDNNSISLNSGSAGYYAIYGYVAKKKGMKKLAAKLFADAKIKIAHERKSYYSNSLYLLATTPNAF